MEIRRAGVRCCLVSFGFGHAGFPSERLRSDKDRVAQGADELRGLLAEFAVKTRDHLSYKSSQDA